MYGDVIALLKELVKALDVADLPLQSPCAYNGNIRIVAVDGHSEVRADICDQDADGAEADHADALSDDLISGKCLLRLFHIRGDVRIIRMFFDPLDAADNVSRRQHQSRDHELLDAVRIGTRRIHDDDTGLRAAV